MRVDPVPQTLAPRRFAEGVATRAPHRHENLGLPHLPAVDHRNRVPAVVHEQFLPGAVRLAHRQVQLASPLPVELAETAVLVPLWATLPVFLPEQAQRHALAPQLLVDL